MESRGLNCSVFYAPIKDGYKKGTVTDSIIVHEVQEKKNRAVISFIDPTRFIRARVGEKNY